jgi:hypothetical protein
VRETPASKRAESHTSTTETHASTTETHTSTTETHASTTEPHTSTTETHAAERLRADLLSRGTVGLNGRGIGVAKDLDGTPANATHAD